MTDKKYEELLEIVGDNLGAAAKKLERYKWQAIETAPKDGTEILALRIEKWDEQLWDNGKSIIKPRIAYTYHVASWKDYCWFVAEEGFGHEYQRITIEPTHWMPLPPAPEKINN